MAHALKIDRPDPAVDIRSVSKSFAVDGHRVHALDDITLDVYENEFVSLIGPSGCGKSTLLRLIAGLDVPDAGAALLDGQPIAAPSLALGVVFQDHRLLPWLSVADNIGLSLHKSPLSPPERKARVQQLIDLVGLTGFENAHPYQLSGGMSQRAAIARALAPRPRILLLDEPLGALDSLTRSRLQKELRRLWLHERLTIVMVTHDVSEALFLSTRVVVMEPRPGRVREILDVNLGETPRRSDPRFVALEQRIVDLLDQSETA